MNRLPPFFVRNANHSQILDLGMSANQLLHFGWIDILPAADNHVTLAVGEIIVAVLVPTGHVADCAVRASECLSSLLRQLPVASKPVWRTRIEFTDFAVDHLATLRIEEFDPPGTEAFATYGTELGQLLFGTQQSHPSSFSRAVGLIELRPPEVFHQRQLGVLAGRRRGD